MRLGFHYHVPFHRSSNGYVLTPGYLGRFIDSLAGQVTKLICFMHSADTADVQYADHRLQAENLEWVDIGPKVAVPKRIVNSKRYTLELRRRVNDIDALLIRGPSPLLPAMADAVNGSIPTALLLVGDYLAGIDELPQPRWRKEAIRVWSYWNYIRQVSVARRSLTFVNSHKLYEQFQNKVPHLRETRTTTLTSVDFYEREDTCHGGTIRLLYTGRIDRAKGLFQILEAVDLLLDRGHDVVLDLVGWPDSKDSILDELMFDARRRHIGERVIYHGFKSVGLALFEHYKNSDIYVLASQKSEGFPRTIWEAMAHSLPVVATQVGSIPMFLRHQTTAWLTHDTTGNSIAEGIEFLINNGDLRRTIIKNALVEVKENTLDRRSMEIVVSLKQWMRDYSN